LIAKIPKGKKKKKKKSSDPNQQNSFPIAPNHKINGTHNKRDIRKREIFTNRERQRSRERERKKLRNSYTQNWLLLSCNKIEELLKFVAGKDEIFALQLANL